MGRKPGLNLFGMPNWFQTQGINMQYQPSSSRGTTVAIKNHAASLVISAGQVENVSTWIVSWSICSGINAVNGQVVMTTDQLRLAFRLKGQFSCPLPEGTEEFLERFGGSHAIPGRFIRYQDFLNIPGPGTGHDGDPNISIDLDEEMKKAVQLLIDSAHQ